MKPTVETRGSENGSIKDRKEQLKLNVMEAEER